MTISVPTTISDCICLGAAQGAQGGSQDTRVSVGHLKLTYAAQRIFGIMQLPTHPERFGQIPVERRDDYARMSAALEDVPTSEWESLTDDLRAAYDALQTQLWVDYPSGFVPLQRRIQLVAKGASESNDDFSYGRHLAILATKAKAEGRVGITFDTDVVTGWCRNEPGHVYGEVLIRRDVPVKDVLLSQRYMPDSRLEADEWLVLNCNAAGSMQVYVQDIRIDASPDVADSLEHLARVTSWADLHQFRTDRLLEHRAMPFFAFRKWSIAAPTVTPTTGATRSNRRPASVLPIILCAIAITWLCCRFLHR